MSAYNTSTYEIPIDNDSKLKNTSYVEMDMKNNVLQNRIARTEKLLEESEKKNALYSRSLKLINKYANVLSNGAKKFLQKGLKQELANFMQICGGNNDIIDLVEILTDFISGIKILKTEAAKKNDLKKHSAKSVDCRIGNKYALEQLEKENQQLKDKLDKLGKGQLNCNNCHAKIDVKKLLNTSNPLMMKSSVLSQIEKHAALDSVQQPNTLDISKFSELHSLHSLLKDDNNENKKAISKIHAFGQRDSLCIDDSSVFLKKNNVKSQNTSAIPMLSINDTIEDIKIGKDKSCINWIIKEIEDSEKTGTEYSIQSNQEEDEEDLPLGPRNLLNDFNKVADSYQNSFSLYNNPKDKEKTQVRDIESFDLYAVSHLPPDKVQNMQNNIEAIDMSNTILDDSSNLVDKTLNSIEPNKQIAKKINASDMDSNERLMKSQETLKVEAVYAFRQQKGKPSPDLTSVDLDSIDEAKNTKRVSFVKKIDEVISKAAKGDQNPHQQHTVRNVSQKGLIASKSGNLITAKTKLSNFNERNERNTFHNGMGLQNNNCNLEDKQKASTSRLNQKAQPVVKKFISTERTLNNLISTNIGRNSLKPKKPFS